MTFEQIIILACSILLAIVLLGFLVSYILFKKQNNFANKEFRNNKNTLRVFILDLKSNTCLTFNRSNFSRKKESTMTEFYNEFAPEDREKLIVWIGSLLDPTSDEDQYLDINVLVNKNKDKSFSMLLVEKIDIKNQVIHLNSYLLKNLNKSDTPTHNRHHLISRETMIKKIADSKQEKGVTFCINFYHLKPHYNKKNEISHLAFKKIEDLLLPYSNNNIMFYEYNEHQIIVTNLSLNTRYGSLQFVKTIKNEISRLLTLYSFSDVIGFAFGAIENKLDAGDVDSLLTNVVSVSEIAVDLSEPIMWYQQGMKLDEMADSEYRTEVERIIRDKKLQYLYRPIYDTKRNEILGYESIVKPIESSFANLQDLKKYAAKTEDDKELFSTIARNSISRFISEKGSNTGTIFFSVSYQENLYILRTFGHIADIKEINVVFIFDEQEFVDLSNGNEDSIVNQLRQLKSYGYEVALHLNNTQLTLAHEIYAICDYFFIDVSNISEKQADTRALTLLHGLIERLLPFKKKTITINIANWSAAELVMKLGIDLISGEVIAPSDELVLPLPPKSIKKIGQLNNI